MKVSSHMVSYAVELGKQMNAAEKCVWSLSFGAKDQTSFAVSAQAMKWHLRKAIGAIEMMEHVARDEERRDAADHA